MLFKVFSNSNHSEILSDELNLSKAVLWDNKNYKQQRSTSPYYKEYTSSLLQGMAKPVAGAGWWDGGAAPPAVCSSDRLCHLSSPLLTKSHLIV